MIEVGELIRTEDGIRKIVEINTGNRKTYYGQYILDKKYKGSYSIAEKNIVKHSKNIIDLIEVGDYVNGYLVTSIDEKANTIYVLDGMYEYPSLYINERIKSVVTREQFSQAEYKIKEDE